MGRLVLFCLFTGCEVQGVCPTLGRIKAVEANPKSFLFIVFHMYIIPKVVWFVKPYRAFFQVFQKVFLVCVWPVGRCSRRTGLPFCNAFVTTQHVWNEILIYVHVVIYCDVWKPKITQDPTDFTNLAVLIWHAFFHLVRDCLWPITHNFFLFIVSHAPIISDSW